MKPGRGFTLVEVIAVVVVLAVLAGVALPRYFNQSDRAREAADEQSIAAINTALIQRHTKNRAEGADSAQWVTSLVQVAAVMEFDELPNGIRIVDGTQFEDQRGNRYRLEPETEARAARIVLVDGAGAGDDGGDEEEEEGAADLPWPMVVVCLLPWMGRERRRDETERAVS